jgi:hypothetical protein
MHAVHATESQVGKAATARFQLVYPRHVKSWIHIPNGAWLGGNTAQRARQMARLKAEGLQPGASDYLVAVPRGQYPGMFLEIKAKGKIPTPKQHEFLAEMANQGYCARWAADVAPVWDMIQWYMAGAAE